MGIVMIDENTIAHIERLRDRDKTVFNCERDHMLKGFYEQVRQERMEQKKIKRTLKIIVVSFILLMTVMVANLQTLSSWEKKAMNWFLQYPHSFENPFNIKQ
jgi:uncharacterized membrane protein